MQNRTLTTAITAIITHLEEAAKTKVAALDEKTAAAAAIITTARLQ